MTDETTQVHSTSQDAEPTQPGATSSDQPTEGNEQSTQTEATTEQEQEGKDPNGWALKRIGELTRQRHEAERKAEAAASEAQRYRQLMDQMNKGEGGQGDQQHDHQQPQDIDALVTKRAQELAQQQASQQRGQSVATTGAAEYPDFSTAVQTLDALGISNEQVQNLLSMDDAHKVIYTLGKNPEEAARILSLPPLQQGRELERLATKAAKAPAPPAVSKAPAPISPVDGNVTAESDPAKMSTAEWVKWREKQLKIT